MSWSTAPAESFRWHSRRRESSRTPPRAALLQQMGLDLPDSVEIRVWDTSAETRYLVLPLRPAGSEGLAEDELAAIVTRDAMIGVARIDSPPGN